MTDSPAVSTPPPDAPLVNPARLYAALLIVLALANLAGICVYLMVIDLPPGARTPSSTRLPDWSLPWIVMVNAVYFGVTLGALSLQQNCAVAGRRWLRAMNWALLIAFPFGTAVAAYWFRKVDRAQ